MQHCEAVEAAGELKLKRFRDSGKYLEGDFEDTIRILVWGFFVNWRNEGSLYEGRNWEVNGVFSEKEMEMESMSGIKRGLWVKMRGECEWSFWNFEEGLLRG